MDAGSFEIYRVIKKSLGTWWLQYRNLQVMFKVSPISLQTIIDTPNCLLEDRVQYSTVHIPNVFCDGHLHLINCVGIVRIHWVQVHRDFLITRYFEAEVCFCIFQLTTNNAPTLFVSKRIDTNFWPSSWLTLTCRHQISYFWTNPQKHNVIYFFFFRSCDRAS